MMLKLVCQLMPAERTWATLQALRLNSQCCPNTQAHCMEGLEQQRSELKVSLVQDTSNSGAPLTLCYKSQLTLCCWSDAA